MGMVNNSRLIQRECEFRVKLDLSEFYYLSVLYSVSVADVLKNHFLTVNPFLTRSLKKKRTTFKKCRLLSFLMKQWHLLYFYIILFFLISLPYV